MLFNYNTFSPIKGIFIFFMELLVLRFIEELNYFLDSYYDAAYSLSSTSPVSGKALVDEEE